MCGIAGILALGSDERVDESHLRMMAAELRHRGPDDEGFYVDPQRRCGLAFRRLSIIDVAGGHQPLTNEDGTVWLVFNGEIYNFRELRDELRAAGHTFKTESDSEVIVHGYEEWGDGCFNRFAGMFALAIWDQKDERLVLARDRLGKKPLIYRWDHGTAYFASEAKAILALPGQARELKREALHEYLLFQYIRPPNSIYHGMAKMPPGCRAVFDLKSRHFTTPQPYWEPPKAPEPWDGDYQSAKTELGRLLTRAVEKRLVADVPLGAFLSGGMDSSIVVGLMRKLGVAPLRTFSIRFEDARYDESPHAARVARHFQTEHHEHVVTPRAREIIDTLAYHYDEPFGDSSAIPTYYVSRYTRESVTVALTGDGGDECFMGYDRYVGMRLADRLARVPLAIRRGIARASRFLPRGRAKSRSQRIYRFASELAKSPARRYLGWVGVFSPIDLLSAYRGPFAEAIRSSNDDEPIRWFEEQFAGAPGSSAEKANYVDMISYLPYDLLTKVDIASMACSLECRSPFLDHELIEFSRRLPMEWKLGPGGGKRILRDWARELLPPEILDRRKMGFGVPVGEWFRGELRDDLRETLTAPGSLAADVFEPSWLSNLIDEHQSARVNHEHRLWALYMLEHWYRRWRPSIG